MSAQADPDTEALSAMLMLLLLVILIFAVIGGRSYFDRRRVR